MSTLAIIEKVTADREAAIRDAILRKLTDNGRIMPGEYLCTVTHKLANHAKTLPEALRDHFMSVSFFFPDHTGRAQWQ